MIHKSNNIATTSTRSKRRGAAKHRVEERGAFVNYILQASVPECRSGVASRARQ